MLIYIQKSQENTIRSNLNDSRLCFLFFMKYSYNMSFFLFIYRCLIHMLDKSSQSCHNWLHINRICVHFNIFITFEPSPYTHDTKSTLEINYIQMGWFRGLTVQHNINMTSSAVSFRWDLARYTIYDAFTGIVTISYRKYTLTRVSDTLTIKNQGF